MSPQKHLLSSSIISIILYSTTGSIKAAVLQLIAGVFIDIDHIPEYLFRKKESRSLNDFFNLKMNLAFDKLILILHSYELWIASSIFLYLYFSPLIGASLAIGGIHHLLLDQIGNPTKPLSYFILWRAKKKFSSGECFSDE